MMKTLKAIGLLVFPGMFVLMCAVFLFNWDVPNSFIPEFAVTAFRTVFTGIIPVVVAFLALKTYRHKNIFSTLLLCCAMLVFGIGNTAAGWLRFSVPGSGSRILFNISVFLSAVLFFSSITWNRKKLNMYSGSFRDLLFIALSVGGIHIILLEVVFKVPAPLLNGNLFRQVILSVSAAIYLATTFISYRKYKNGNNMHTYWMTVSFAMITAGIAIYLFNPAETGVTACLYNGFCDLGGFYLGLSVIKDKKNSAVKGEDIIAGLFADSDRSQNMVRTVIDGISDMIYLKDRQSRLLMVNSAVASFYDKQQNQLLGRSETEFFDDRELGKMILENDRRIMDSGKEEVLEELSGGRIFLSKKIPWKDSRGKVLGLFGISRDITESKKASDEMKAYAHEMEAKNSLVDHFLLNLSHEFRTPLSVVLMAVEMMGYHIGKKEPDLDRLKETFKSVTKNSYRLYKLINNLLDFTKIEAGAMQATFTEIDIVENLRMLVACIEAYDLKRPVSITLQAPQEAVIIASDAPILDRVVLNLVSNALKNVKDEGHITISVKCYDTKVCLSVKDDGPGIPSDKQGTIFDRFTQVNTSLARSSEGCGIGLSLTKSLVHLINGTIWFKSALGEGSEFVVELPFSKKETKGKCMEVNSLTLKQIIEIELSDIA